MHNVSRIISTIILSPIPAGQMPRTYEQIVGNLAMVAPIILVKNQRHFPCLCGAADGNKIKKRTGNPEGPNRRHFAKLSTSTKQAHLIPISIRR